MENNNISRDSIIVQIRPGILTPNFYFELSVFVITFAICLILIVITIFLEPFKRTESVKGVVILQSSSTLIYSIVLITKYLSAYFLLINNVKFSIIYTTFSSQLFYFVYNFNYTVPFFITYWRFSLIVLGKKTSLTEKVFIGCFSMVFNFIAFLYVIFYSTNLAKTSFYTAIYDLGLFTDSVFPWFDTLPQIAGCILGIILNLIILKKIWNHQKTMRNKSTISKNDKTLTFNTLFQTIMPFMIIVSYNLYFCVLIDYGFQSNTFRQFIKYIEIVYLPCCPLSFVFFLEIYRIQFINFFFPNKKLFKKSTNSTSINQITTKSVL
uniref:Serpentine receptor class gamma n=1 Tax=Strongyloides venezuelensis TaxID=75913 RepID=A0A0K0G5E3_STRVS